MGDVSAEPSMEDILSSIKRIIAEEGDAPARPRRPSRPSSPVAVEPQDEVLELSHPMASAMPTPPDPAPEMTPATTPPAALAPEPAPEPIVSRAAMEASRGSLDALSRLVVRPDPGSDGTLEGLVRELLRPMLRDWLDAHLPTLVEAMVAKEIARIAGSDR